MKIVLIGCGQVGRAFLELIPICKLLSPDIHKNIFIIEPRKIPRLALFKPYSIKHLRAALTQNNMDKILGKYLETGDVVVDVSVNVDALSVMKWCNKKNCIYINTSMEDWLVESPETIDSDPKALYERSLYSRILSGKKQFGKSGPSMLADQGMNPGLISQFTMRAIDDFSKHSQNQQAMDFAQIGLYAEAARELNIRVIHITEHDTQITKKVRPPGVFWNTWSAEGLLAESLDPVQIGIGTEDDSNFVKGSIVPEEGPGNVCIMPQRGMDCRLWSVTPSRHKSGFQKFVGCSIPHGEANTISNVLTTYDEIGHPTYRPSVFFVYKPCPSGCSSLTEVKQNKYTPQEKYHTLSLPEIRDGYDAIGVLLITADEKGYKNSWWCGTVLDTSDMAKIGIKYSGPTTIQVAISLISALKWLLEHPGEGFLTPESLPHIQMLNDAMPYLGKVYSGPVKMPHHKKVNYDAYKYKN